VSAADREARRPARWPIVLLFLIALVCAAGAGYRIRLAAKAEEDIAALREASSLDPQIVYISLADASGGAEAPAAPPEEAADTAQAAAIARVQSLQEKNSELVGWLEMAAAGVDYPVMQSPTRPSFYLDHNFAGEQSKAGLPFIDEGCDPVDGLNRIIYGHNMNNGTMFGSLKRYLDAAFFAENASFSLDTARGRESYRMIAVYEAKIESDSFAFYTYNNIQDEDAYLEYVSNIMARSVHGSGELPRFGQKLLTLVTCIRYRPNDRLVLVAVETS
jgi:sortase B